MKRAIAIAGAAVCVIGCSMLARDFNKATLVGELKLRYGASSSSAVSLPSGKARLLIAVPGYRCTVPKPDASIAIRIAGDRVKGFEESVRLGDLTWAFAIDSCDAVGYAEDNRRLIAKVLDDDSPARVTARIESASGTSTQNVFLWLTYGDRVPTNRIFESHKQ